MSFKANNIKKLGEVPAKKAGISPILETQTTKPSLELSKQELELLLYCIKHSTFQGASIELVYNLVSKLQNYLLNTNK
jgi:hypothetical protein